MTTRGRRGVGWYEVIKRIKGRPYRYKQRTWRHGGKVHTESHYIGPASPSDVVRVQAETQQRRAGPSRARVRGVIKLLTNPATASQSWAHYWDEKPVNTTARQPTLVRNLIRAHSINTIHSPNAAAYHRGADTLLMPPPTHFHSADNYILTVLHEMAHWSGAAGRLGRLFGRMSGTTEEQEHYAREEVVAEATAWVVMAELGLRPGREEIATHAHYLQWWLARTPDPAATLAYAEDEAQRAARLILAVNTTL